MRILATSIRHGYSRGVVMRMALGKSDFVIMAVRFMVQAQTGNEFVRFRYRLVRFDKAMVLGKRELLAAAVGTLGFQPDLIGLPAMVMRTFKEQPEAWRHPVFEDLKAHRAMIGGNRSCFVVMVMGSVDDSLLLPGTPQHPEGNGDDQYAGCQLEEG